MQSVLIFAESWLGLLNPAGPIPITWAHEFNNDAVKKFVLVAPGQARGDARVGLQAFRRIHLILTGKFPAN